MLKRMEGGLCSASELRTPSGLKASVLEVMSVKFRVFQKYIANAEADGGRTLVSERAQDPKWFEGLDPSEKTKEQAMSKRVKDRMRGYFYKTKTALQSSDLYVKSKNGRGKKLIDQFILELSKLLESHKYNDTYFNRKAKPEARLCDESGQFQCGGLWSNDKCVYAKDHVINPYRSREERIIFQTWNLDHKIELSRSIIPKVLDAIEGLYVGNIKCVSCKMDSKNGDIETDRYYLQIFTKDNLKLVHIVCHHKGKHDAQSDVYTVCKQCFSKQTLEHEI
ncbi:hypothetical protein NE865_00035 [Phthorimaea operculella]|nr:hypothetical protein NE865_00035 [Phthorimaea operculella]